MKVLHVIPSVSERSGGPGQAIFPMCRALQEKGVDVTLATTDADLSGQHGPTSRNAESIDESRDRQSSIPISYKGVSTAIFPSQLGNSFKYSRPLAVWLNANVKSFDLVHIHAVFNHACIATARACRKHNVPYIVRPLGTLDPWGMKQKSLRKTLFWQLAAKRMMHDAAAVHYTARGEQEGTERSLGLNHGRVVPLGIDPQIATAPLSPEYFAREFPELEKSPYVLVLSRLLPTKGLDVLLDAFLPLIKQQEFIGWRLVLAGEGPEDYVAGLKQKIERHNAVSSVLFPGWLEGEKKNTILRNSALLALPSYHENFGLCVMEALACGVPVLVSPHVNLSEEIRDAGAGWSAAIQKAAMEAALKEALGSAIERTTRGSAGKTLSARFTWSEIAKQLVTVYSDVLAERGQLQTPVIACA
jgi:glycosyltransferase involved in cell wall biosynthesis